MLGFDVDLNDCKSKGKISSSALNFPSYSPLSSPNYIYSEQKQIIVKNRSRQEKLLSLSLSADFHVI